MDSGVDVLRCQALLLKFFLLVGGAQCTEYIRALTASILQWSNYQSCQHPCWQLFANNASAFNEESGEISLSILARDIARGGVRSDCNKVSQTFKLVKAKAELAEDVGLDISGGDFGSDEHGRRIKSDCPEVKVTAAFFSGVIRHVLAGAYRHYDNKCGVLAKGVRSARPTVAMEAHPVWFRSVTPLLDGAVKKLSTATQSFWVAPHADIWPEAIPAINFDSDSDDQERRQRGANEAGQPKNRNQLNKRKRSAPAAAPKKKAKLNEDKLVGCVLAVPAWKFGMAWAGRNFHRPLAAVLIGDVVALDPTRSLLPFSCEMREDKGFTIHLKRSEVEEFKLEGEAAAAAEDTPWKAGHEI